MSHSHPAAMAGEELLRECEETRTRRGGPGGQHRNKVETAVVLTHRPSGTSAEASERRSQAENRRVALMRLRLKLAIEHRSPAGSPAAEPSALWRARVRGGRIVVAADHDDLPALLAEAFDQLQSTGWEVATAAVRLGVTTSQLIKLVHKSPAAWTAINESRASHGLPPLKHG